MQTRRILGTAVAAVLVAVTGGAKADEAITGMWRTPKGDAASIARCGDGYCITSESGSAKGRRIGRFTQDADGYAGELTDPSSGRTYSGTGKLQGSNLKLTGCALRIFCRSQTWTRP